MFALPTVSTPFEILECDPIFSLLKLFRSNRNIKAQLCHRFLLFSFPDNTRERASFEIDIASQTGCSFFCSYISQRCPISVAAFAKIPVVFALVYRSRLTPKVWYFLAPIYISHSPWYHSFYFRFSADYSVK